MITQAMLDAERKRVADGEYRKSPRDVAHGWDACLAFLREHGKYIGADMDVEGFPSKVVVRVEIPAR